MKKTECYTEEEAIAFLQSLGYKVIPCEKNSTYARGQEATERYSMEFLQERLHYEDMLMQEKSDHRMIDTFFHYLYSAVNTKKSTLRVNGEDKPREVVVSVLLKLEYFDFLYAIEQYKNNTTKVRNHGAYIITLLYNAKAQHEADISNQVQHDLYS